MDQGALARHDPFVPPEVLPVNGAHSSVAFVEARTERAYEKGQLPGARHPPAGELHDVVGGVRRLTAAGALTARLRAVGIGAGPVVVYGARGGADAAHVLWRLQAFGHLAVFMLDGGIEGWLAAGGRLEGVEAVPTRAPGGQPLDLHLDPASLITFEELRTRLEDPDLAIVDTRSREEFAGEVAAARRAGKVPGAGLYSWDDAIDEGLRVAPREQLAADLAVALQHPEVALYCPAECERRTPTQC